VAWPVLEEEKGVMAATSSSSPPMAIDTTSNRVGERVHGRVRASEGDADSELEGVESSVFALEGTGRGRIRVGNGGAQTHTWRPHP
jgi:hypothetical protein